MYNLQLYFTVFTHVLFYHYYIAYHFFQVKLCSYGNYLQYHYQYIITALLLLLLLLLKDNLTFICITINLKFLSDLYLPLFSQEKKKHTHKTNLYILLFKIFSPPFFILQI
uniref:Transmembrane protein n=1 Tax=Opuntia streptacantha TaxID=393608 RepID=A0A7C9DEZ1_OPUST